MTLHTTQPNHDQFLLSLLHSEMLPLNINLTLRLVSFETEKIAALKLANPDELSDQSIFEFWKNGEGITLYSQSVKTMPRDNAIFEMEYERIHPKDTQTPTAKNGNTEQPRLTRNTLNVTPGIRPFSTEIPLTVISDFTVYTDLKPETDPTSKLTSPDFIYFETGTKILHQGTFVFEQSTSQDGKQKRFLFISAEIQDIDGNPLSIHVPD
ncbi:hypothetical protein P0Y35_08145 [Kiritimatiellaeota bacterium B1221]|nr:hypothetical protein [Kiritimatiellaeota bacterium B1221]